MAESPAQTIQFGVPLDDKSFYYFLALAAGALIVFLFSYNKFGETAVDDDDLVVQFPTKYLATREEFARAMIVYMATMMVALGVFSLLGPSALTLAGGSVPTAATHALPLLVALILVGVIPNFPLLREIERNLRRFAHERAYIPAAARATAEKMAVADFDFGRYDKDLIFAEPSMVNVKRSDLSRPRGSLEYCWARLCALSYEMQSGREAESLGALEEPLWTRLEEKRRALASDVTEYRERLKRDRSYTNVELHENIRKTLRTYHRFLGCAVRHRLGPDANINLELGRFGFVLPPRHAARINPNDTILGGLFVMALSLFVLVFLAATLSALWHPSPFFPASALDAFIWCASATSAHGAAILVADRVRARLIARGRWYRARGTARYSPLANLVRVGIICGLAGYVVLVLWGLVYQREITLAIVKGMAAYAAMPATTGAFYAFHLDNIELRCRPSRVLEVTVQAVVTAFFGLAACCAWLTLIGESLSKGYDLVIMVTLFGAIIGSSLAWYIPEAVPEIRPDPLGDESADRVLKLETAATDHFKDVSLARQWLDRRFAELGDRTPRAAAVESVEGYDDAIELLQRTPRLLAA
jgi:hypothetical protein